MHINSATHQKRVHYAAVVTWQQWKLLDAMITTIGWVSLFWTHDLLSEHQASDAQNDVFCMGVRPPGVIMRPWWQRAPKE